MDLNEHISEEQLHEYLDHESDDRARIELHLAACTDCSARLRALQELFSEIESLPDLQPSPAFSVRLAPEPSPSIRLPRSLTLTVTLQAALAIVTILVAAPFVMQFVSSYVSVLPVSSPVDLILFLQSQWTAGLDTLATLQIPSLPEIPVVEASGLVLMSTVIAASLLWLVGNGLLLRNQMK